MPTVEKLNLPSGYGTTTTTLEWGAVREQLEEAKQYWLATNRAVGSPHIIPIDGVWLDDLWYYGGSPDTAHWRLVQRDPNVTMHLPDPWRVVVVEGAVRKADPSPGIAQQLADVSNQKYPDYGFTYEPSSFTGALVLQPTRVLAWSSFPNDCTRFTFAG